MITFRLWRVLLLASAFVAPLHIEGAVHHTVVVVQYDRTTVDTQLELASSTWTRHSVKPRGL